MKALKTKQVINFLNDYKKICEKHRIELIAGMDAEMFLDNFSKNQFNGFLIRLAEQDGIKIKISKNEKIVKNS